MTASLLTGAYLVRKSVQRSALAGLRRQVELLAQQDRASAGPFGRFLETQDERLSVLPRRRAALLLPDAASGRVTVNGTDYLYATRARRDDMLVLLRTARSVRSDSRSVWLALLVAAGLGGAVAVALAALLARSIARPIARTARASERLAAGRTPESLPATGARELRVLAQSFNDLVKQLARARETERSFLLSISHELKTPLTAIRGYAEALEEGVLTAERAIEVIRTEAARLERLIADLLHLARLDRQRFDIKPADVDLVQIARETVARHQARADELDVQLVLRVDAPAPARADPDRVLQALSNLVENALRCTPSGGLVTLSAEPGRLAVEDTGPGLAPDELPRAFERFFLYRRYGNERPVGTGLGLAIVRELALAMGGDVHVSSSPGRGARFTILLPERAVQNPDGT